MARRSTRTVADALALPESFAPEEGRAERAPLVNAMVAACRSTDGAINEALRRRFDLYADIIDRYARIEGVHKYVVYGSLLRQAPTEDLPIEWVDAVFPVIDDHLRLRILKLGESKTPGYIGRTMGDETAEIAVARKNGLSSAEELHEAIALYKATKNETTAPMPTGRATAEPRPESAPAASPEPAPASAAPHLVTADELFGNVPLALQAKPHQKYEFPPELLDDPKAFKAAQSIANARNYKVRAGAKLTEQEDVQGRMAGSFVGQAKRRQQRTGSSAPPRLG